MNEIKQIREKTGMSQSRFAEHFHISIRTLQNWERNEPSDPPEHVIYMIKYILYLEKILEKEKQKNIQNRRRRSEQQLEP